MKIRVLSRNDIMSVVDIDRVMSTVEGIYKSKAEQKTVVWPTVFHEWEPGVHDMDIKSGYIKGDELHGLKCINYNERNAEKGLPTLVGLIVVFDTETGMPLGLLDGSLITGLRTGCAGAAGAKYLARQDSKTLFVLGAGNQAFFQVGAFVRNFPNLEKIYICDKVSPANAEKFVSEIKNRLQNELRIDAGKLMFIAASSEEEMAKAVSDSDMIVTVTPAREPVIRKEWVKPGTHLSCIGSDMSGKEEIDPELFRDAVIFADDLKHTIPDGEMEIPLKKGIIKESDLSGEIGELITGKTTGRTNDSQITIYDACGMALLDIAAAKAALDLAEEQGIGKIVEM